MEYELKTNRGLSMKFVSDTFNPEEYITVLNDETVLTVAVGDMVTQKNNIQSIAPVYPEGAEPGGQKIVIHTNFNEVLIAHVDDYNAPDVSQSLNDRVKQFILLGGVIVHKHNANLILPAE